MTCIYEVHQSIALGKQGEPLAFNFSSLIKMWKEVDYYVTFPLKCVDDVRQSIRNLSKNFDFFLLVGLNDEYEPV